MTNSSAEAAADAPGGYGGSARWSIRELIVPGCVLLGAAVLPLLVGEYALRVVTTIFMYLALAQAWNMIGGYAGLLSLAHPAFFGTGAIVMSVMLINGVPLGVSILCAAAASLAIAGLVAIPTLRLRGHYFVIATLLVAEGARNLAVNSSFPSLKFRGGIAVNVINATGLTELTGYQFNLLFYFLMLLMAVLATVCVMGLDRSRWGAALRAYRDDKSAAAALGVPTTSLLIVVFLISAALASLTGSVWALWLGVIEANEAYALKLTFQIVVMVFLGGKSTIWGPAIGVIAILLLDELIGVEFAEYSLVISGAIVVAIVLFLPDGLIRMFRDGPKVLSPTSLKANYSRYRVR